MEPLILIFVYYVWCILNFTGTAFEIFSFIYAFDCFDVDSGPNSFKRVIIPDFQERPFIVILNQWQTLFSRLRLILAADLFKVIRL